MDDQVTRDVIFASQNADSKVAELLRRLDIERVYWRDACAYLASCHAATAEYDGTIKSVSKARKARFLGICQMCVEVLTRKWYKKYSYNNVDDVEAAKVRCEQAAENLK